MRVLLKVHIPSAKGSAALRDGSMQRTMEEFMSAVNPEAAYFAPDGGLRTAFFVFDMQDPSDMPPLLERSWSDSSRRSTRPSTSPP
jgi:hypothetical protein